MVELRMNGAGERCGADEQHGAELARRVRYGLGALRQGGFQAVKLSG